MGAHTFHLLIVERTNNSKTKTMNPSLLSLPPPWLPLKAKSSSQETSPQLLVCHSPTTASTALPLALLPHQLSTLRPPLLPPSLPLSQLLASSQPPPRPTLSHQQGSSTSQLSLSRSTRPLSNTDTRSTTTATCSIFNFEGDAFNNHRDEG